MSVERGKIVIIGAGHVGSAILNALLGMNLAKEIVLINLDREQALGEAAAERGVQLTGSFDPAALGAGYGDFYDAYHPRPEFVRGLLEEAGIC